MDAFEFWKKVDLALKGKTLVTLAESQELNYKTLKNQRSAVRLPNLEDATKIAKGLNISLDSLVGINAKTLSEEMQIVVDYLRDHPEDVQYLIGLWHLREKKAIPTSNIA